MPRATKTRGKRPLEDADTNAPRNTRKAKRAELRKGDETVQRPVNEKSQTESRKGQSKKQADRDDNRWKNAEKDQINERPLVGEKDSTQNTRDKSKETGSCSSCINENSGVSWEIPIENNRDPENPKGLRGPDGNLQTPDILPLEAEAAADADLISRAYSTFDGTPGRLYTLGNDNWRLENNEWLKMNARKLNGRKYIWTHKPRDGEVTGSQIGTRTLVNYSAVASDEEKRAVKELDRELLRDENPETSERFQKELERKETARKPTDWICMCRPDWDIIDETDGDRRESRSEDTFAKYEDGCEMGHHRDGFLADDFPKHKWIFTKTGQQWFKYWMSEQAKRDQDLFGTYMYNDWTGYGIYEIFENQVRDSWVRIKSSLTLIRFNVLKSSLLRRYRTL